MAQETELVENWLVDRNVELKILQALYQQALLQVEIFWKEKVGDKWITEGERNTSYFHAKANESRKGHTTRIQLEEDGEQIEDLDQIDTVAVAYYESQLSSTSPLDSNEELIEVILMLATLSPIDLLTSLPCFEEVKNVVYGLNPLGAP